MADVDKLFASRRWCYFIPRDAFVKGQGFKVSIVFEGEIGHFPTGTKDKAPWFWGMTYEEAEEAAALANERLGFSANDVWAIVSSAKVV